MHEEERLPHRPTPGAREPGQRFWLLIERGTDPTGMFCIQLPDGGEALPVFSFEEEAEMFLALSELERKYRVRMTTTGELVSLLFGPGRDIEHVTLDPLAEFDVEALLQLVSVGRERFIRVLLGRVPRPERSMQKAGSGRSALTAPQPARTVEC